MKIVSLATRRPVTVVVFFVALVIFGLISFRELPVDLLPDLSFPTLTIRTEYPGVAPADVETYVTTPIEDAVGIVSGLVDLSSVSRAGLSDVIMEFAWGTDMDFAAIDVREQLAQLGLPGGAEDPILLRFDPALDPIMRISVGSATPGDVPLADQAGLRLLADQSIKQRLESIDGVAAAIVAGGVEEEIQINVDQSRAALLGILLSQIASRLQRENVDVTGGSIADGAAEYVVRVLARFTDLDEIGRIVVGDVGDVQVRLQDLAEVRSGYREQSTITRTNRRPSVEIAIHKEAAANTVAVAAAVNTRLGEVEEELAGVVDVELRVVSDQSRFIAQSIRDVIQAAVFGGLLAIAVLYLFLRRLRSTLVVGLAIPISVVASFFLMFLGGVSLNIMSLGGLALGIGMLVDSSIVVLESIDRHRVAGADRVTAARAGGAEVGSAVVAATLTTLCVFIPVVFVSGIAGQLFVDPALTVTFSLLVSLAVALTLIPMASAVGSRIDPPGGAALRPAVWYRWGCRDAAASRGRRGGRPRVVVGTGGSGAGARDPGAHPRRRDRAAHAHLAAGMAVRQLLPRHERGLPAGAGVGAAPSPAGHPPRRCPAGRLREPGVVARHRADPRDPPGHPGRRRGVAARHAGGAYRCHPGRDAAPSSRTAGGGADLRGGRLIAHRR